jgi:thioredoxin reductase
MHDVIVIGGGPAGLQAALTLGRMHHSVLVLDSGRYRNAPATHMHNFATHDGRPPAEFRAMARADLEQYSTVQVLEQVAREVREGDSGFEVALEDGTVAQGAAVILATGVRDTLPDIPGLSEHFGTLVHHCPFCHGHELAGGTVGVQGSPRAAHLVPMLSRIADQVVVVQHDWSPTEEDEGWLHTVRLVPGRIEKVLAQDDRLLLQLADDEVVLDGFFAATEFEQAAPFAEQLGLQTLDSGCIEVDVMGRTSRRGVYAAGDLAHGAALPMPMMSVLGAAAAGQVAAGASVADLIAAG